MSTELQKHKYSVFAKDMLGDTVQVGSDLSPLDAARLFWHHTNTFSAKIGVTREAWIVDEGDQTNLAWEYMRGYTYDGVKYMSRPVQPTETRNYGKQKA